MIELDGFENDNRGRGSDAGVQRKVARSPQPKGYQGSEEDKENDEGDIAQQSKSDIKPQYTNSVAFRKQQMQRNRTKKISSKVSIGKGSNEGKDQPGMFSFLPFQDMRSPERRNLNNEIDQMEKFKVDCKTMDKEQLIEKLSLMNLDHKRIVADLKNKIENDLALGQAMSKSTIDKYTNEILRLEKQVKLHQSEVAKIKQA